MRLDRWLGPCIALLALVWLATLRAWLRDDSPDLAVTMKALDSALARAEEAANSFMPGSRRRPDAADTAAPGA